MELKAVGIRRVIDKVGRVVLPKEVRDTQGMEEGDAVEFFQVEGGIFVKLVDKESGEK